MWLPIIEILAQHTISSRITKRQSSAMTRQLSWSQSTLSTITTREQHTFVFSSMTTLSNAFNVPQNLIKNKQYHLDGSLTHTKKWEISQRQKTITFKLMRYLSSPNIRLLPSKWTRRLTQIKRKASLPEYLDDSSPLSFINIRIQLWRYMGQLVLSFHIRASFSSAYHYVTWTKAHDQHRPTINLGL